MAPPGGFAEKMAVLSELGFRQVGTSPGPLESVPVGRGRHRVTCRRPSMGTLVSVTAIDESGDRVRQAVGKAFETMDRVVGLLDRYDPASALAVLNAQGCIRHPPPELQAVMDASLDLHATSAGAFDPTVQPLVDLFRGRRQPSGVRGRRPAPASPPPGEGEIREALSLVGVRRVERSTSAIRLTRRGMGLTLDGIAKGFVVDRMTRVLEESGLRHFLVDAGGDIRSLGRREDGSPWRVAVQDPRKAGDFPEVLGLSDRAVATSGSYEHHFDRARGLHHIVSGSTGRSPDVVESVSVVAPTAMAADALATCAFVLGPVRGLAFIDSYPRCAGLMVDDQGLRHRSRRWQSVVDSPTRKEEAP